jgi:hypothetical protein
MAALGRYGLAVRELPPGVRVPDTAIAADVAKQSAATVPVTDYFDARRVCRKCERSFLFFAEEQRFWYEELGFPLEADALECVSCRRDERRLRATREEYEALLASPSRTEAETFRLVGCAVVLVETGVCATKLVSRLHALLKPMLADSQGPSTPRRERFCQRSRPCHTRDDGGQLVTSSVCRSRDLSRRDAPGRRAFRVLRKWYTIDKAPLKSSRASVARESAGRAVAAH